MTENINAYCDICGAGYHYCGDCADQRKLRPWKTVTDTVDHYKIFLAIHDYSVGKDKERAKRELAKCNLTDKDTFKPDIKAVIDEILGADNEIETTVKKVDKRKK